METIKYAMAAVGGFLGNYLGVWDGMLDALLACVVIDYITGVLLAINEKTLSSDIGFRGIAKKVLIFALVGLANLLDGFLGADRIIRAAVIAFYISNEGISIIENAAAIGLPVPQKLLMVLEQIKGDSKEGKK